jgi:endonuclease/exonuclease/phosphatase family metal-dependent hydrolase
MTGHPERVVRALTWNLFHGRDFPPDPALFTWRSRLLRITERNATHVQVNRPLLGEFAALLAGLSWDVALLQEAPPRWLDRLAYACSATGELALTDRNSLAPLRALAARFNPDLIASNEGGSNQVLLRPPWRASDTHRVVLTERPERRVLLLVRATGAGELCVGCLHASRSPEPAARDVRRAAEAALEWAGDAPLLLGGDFNVRPEEDRRLFDQLGLGPALARSIDQLVAARLRPIEGPVVLPPEAREVSDPSGQVIRLSDHPPVAGSFSMR